MTDLMQMRCEQRRYSSLLASIVSKEDEVDRSHPFADGIDPSALPTRQKEENTESSPPTVAIPVIPQWGATHSGKRVETQPVAKFTFARNSTSTEIMFNPPM